VGLGERIATVGRRLGIEPPAVERSTLPLSFEQWLGFFQYSGNTYPYLQVQQTLAGGKTEDIPGDFPGFAAGGYEGNGVIFACMLARFSVFSEARFQFRQRRAGRPGDLFGTEALRPLEEPWPGGTTGDLLARAITDVDLAGTFFCRRTGSNLQRLRPDWVTIVIGGGGAGSLDAQVGGVMYEPGGPGSSEPAVLIPVEDLAIWAPTPDPLANYRGMSWLHPIVPEIQADHAATTHKLKFFENGATPNMVVRMDPSVTAEKFEKFVKAFQEKHEGLDHAYKTLFLAGGADAKVVGADLRQLDFKQTQGGGETRIAAAAGVPPVIVGLSEGLQAATYSNYAQARRRYADGTIRPLWRSFAGAMANIIDVPAGAELWYDDRDVPFLREDLKDVAEIHQMEASTIKVLIDAGFTPETVVAAVTSGDYGRLVHTGLYSVQLQPPMPELPPTTPELEAGRALAKLVTAMGRNGD